MAVSTVLDRRSGSSPPALENRVVDATLRCIARWGLAKTTLDDVAREAGCSRATVYRAFPGGKDALFDAVVRRELIEFFERLRARLDAAESLEDLLVIGLAEASRALREHAALQFLMTYEPEVVLPNVAFHQLDRVLYGATEFAAPFLAPYLREGEAGHAAEWVARLVLSYTLCPSPELDLSRDDHARRLVTTFVLPGLTALTKSPRPKTG
jgi:AcrR family transcriptional regulator